MRFVHTINSMIQILKNAEDASDNWYEKSATDDGEQYVVIDGFGNIPWKPPHSYSSLHQLILVRYKLLVIVARN
jgi:hypothetical protein